MTPNDYGLKRAAYSIAQAGEVLSLGRTTINALVKSGELTPTRFGKKIVFTAPDLARLLDGRRGVTAPADRA